MTTSEGIDEGEYNSDGNEVDEFEDLARELRAQIGDSIRKPSHSKMTQRRVPSSRTRRRTRRRRIMLGK